MPLETWLTYRIEQRELIRCAKNFCRGRLVDIGCGEKPYEELFAPYVSEHVGVDHEVTMHDKSNIDQFGTAYDLPFEDESFDSALCTAVLEHLEEPEQALRECHRVLKPGGTAIYTAPLIWHLHEEPRDFYRYTKHGLRYLFEKVNLEVLEITAYCGFWGTFGQMLVYNLGRLNMGPLRWLRIVAAVGFAIQVVAYVLDKMDKTEQWTSLYLIVARKRKQ